LSCLISVDSNGNISIPGILGVLADDDVLACDVDMRCIAEEEVNVQVLISYGINISW
jgi:hypothetical protein